MAISYGLSATGFAIKPMSQIQTELNQAFQAQFGSGIDISGNSVFGQLIGILAERESLLQELALAVYNSAYPVSASGIPLAYSVTTRGQSKLPATYSTVTATLQGTPGTKIPANSQASVAGTGAVFATSVDTWIVYWGTIALSSDPVPGCTIAVTVNGTPLSVPYNGSPTDGRTAAQQTMQDMATAVLTVSGISSATVTGDQVIIYETAGAPMLTLSNASVTGGTNPPLIAATVGSSGQIQTNMTATTVGAVYAPSGTLTIIQTPIAGWSSVMNATDAAVGRDAQTDAKIRAISPLLAEGGTEIGIKNYISQNVSGVTFSAVSQNNTDTTSYGPGYLLLSGAPQSGQTVSVTVNGTVCSQAFTTDAPTTMANLATAIGAVTNVQSAVLNTQTDVAGTLIDITMVPGYALTLTNASVSGSPSISTTVADGLPPHSVEVFVIGGSDLDVANAIWAAKPAGANTYGPFFTTVQDSAGNNQTVYWSRGSSIPIFITVHVGTVVWNAQIDGGAALTDAISQAIAAYFSGITNGQAVYAWKVAASCLDVSGLADLIVDIGTSSANQTISMGSSPDYIAIAASQIATVAPQNITVGP